MMEKIIVSEMIEKSIYRNILIENILGNFSTTDARIRMRLEKHLPKQEKGNCVRIGHIYCRKRNIITR